MKIVAVVVTFNRREYLLRNIEALLGQVDAKTDILIIDNASTDGTEEAVAPYRDAGQIIYYNTGENLGGAGGFNIGIRRAYELGYDYFWLMDDDVCPHPDALSKLIQAHEDLGGVYGYLAGVVLWKDGTECRMNKLRPRRTGAGPDGVYKRIDFSTFVSLFLPRKTVEEFGLPIKEFFIWGDDIEYTRRITAKKAAYMVPESKVLHDTKNNEGFNIASEEGALDRYRYAYRNEMFSARKEGLRRVCRQRLRIMKHISGVLFSSEGRKREKIQLIRSATKEGRSFNPEIEYVTQGAYGNWERTGLLSALKNSQIDENKMIVLSDTDLHRIQKAQLQTLDDIIDVCDKHGIRYQMSGGSALGTVRHQGFIPWDDDIDFNMPRADVEKFVTEFRKAYGDKYWIHIPGETKNYDSMMLRIMAKNIRARVLMDSEKEECGLLVDIFIVENTYDNAFRRRIHGYGCMAFRYVLSCIRFQRCAEEMQDLFQGDETLQRYLRRRSRWGRLFLTMPLDRWTKGAGKWVQKCKDENSKYVAITAGSKQFFDELYERDKFNTSIDAKFEGRDVKLTADYDNYLRNLYGDYMEIPPEEKRERHVLLDLEFPEETEENAAI